MLLYRRTATCLKKIAGCAVRACSSSFGNRLLMYALTRISTNCTQRARCHATRSERKNQNFVPVAGRRDNDVLGHYLYVIFLKEREVKTILIVLKSVPPIVDRIKCVQEREVALVLRFAI
jgi:hypothetical protein